MIKLIHHLGRFSPSPGKDAVHFAFGRLTCTTRAMPISFGNVAQRWQQATQMIRCWAGLAANEVATVTAFSAELLVFVLFLRCLFCNFTRKLYRYT